jgi:hypothetical protein
MLGSISGICSRDSPNDCLVRDRGVGGSNPLAPTNSSKILGNLQNLTSRLARLEAINCASGTECSVLLTVHLGGIVRDVASWAIAADASRAAAGSNPYASLLGYATWMLFLVWERLASRETRILYAVVMDDLLALAIFSRWRIWETAMRSCATCARSPSVSRTFDVSLRSPPLHSCRCC